MGRLDGKLAMITGGTQGIGRGLVLHFLKEGAKVVYCSRNPANNEDMPRFATAPFVPSVVYLIDVEGSDLERTYDTSASCPHR